MNSQSYQFLDNAANAGVYYYRLKQLDLDGSFKISEIRQVNFSDFFDKISLYPNPANGFVFINNIADYSDINLSILDVTGKVVYQNSFQVDASKLQVDLPTHQPGLYLVKITVDNNTFSEKLEIR